MKELQFLRAIALDHIKTLPRVARNVMRNQVAIAVNNLTLELQPRTAPHEAPKAQAEPTARSPID